MQRLPDGLVDGFGVEAEQGADTGGSRGTEMGNVVDLVLVQRDCANEVDLNLVPGGQTADQIAPRAPGVLGDCEDRRNVVPRVGVLGGEERVVKVQFSHRYPIGPRGPLG